MHEFSKNHLTSHIDSQDQFLNLILSQYIHSISANERDQLLEDAFAKFKANHLTHINIQDNKSHSSISIISKLHEKIATISMKYLHNAF